MTADTIALVIATLIAPSVPVLVSRMMNRPRPPRKPASEPKTLIQEIGGWFLRRFLSPWQVPLLCILLSIYMLYLEFRITTPITRGAVFQISLAVGYIIYSVVNMSISSVWRSIGQLWDSSHKAKEHMLKDDDHILHLYELVKEQADTLSTTKKVITVNAAIAKPEPEKSPGRPEDR